MIFSRSSLLLAAFAATCLIGACAQPEPVYVYVEQPAAVPTPTPRPRVVTQPKPAPQNSPESFEAVTRPQSYSN